MAAADERVNARILYWGIAGAGKTSNLRIVRAKLRPDHRGELRQLPTRIDPTASYEVLPIELGEVGGRKMHIEIVSVPGGPEQAPTRKQLLDRVNGIVLVLDARRECVEANLASVEELRKSLAAWGQALEDLPLVAQYNKRDLADPYVVEELHRKLALPRAAVFEAVATEGKGVLQTLTTISKRVIRVLREGSLAPVPPPLPEPGPPRAPAGPSPAAPRPESPTSLDLPAPDLDARPSRELLEEAMLAEERGERGEAAPPTSVALETPPRGPAAGPAAIPGPAPYAVLEIVAVGEARRTGPRSLRVPVTLASAAGDRFSLALTLQLDPQSDDPSE